MVGRLINPSSELSTWEWIRNISSIGELTEESLETVGLNAVYHIITDGKNQIHHLRISGYPEPSHQEIYDNLSINPPRYARKYFIDKRLSHQKK